MKTIIGLMALVAGVTSQSTFEPADFNITEALLDNGVDVSALPDLAPLVDRAPTGGCSAAVNYNEYDPQMTDRTDQITVQVSQPHLW